MRHLIIFCHNLLHIRKQMSTLGLIAFRRAASLHLWNGGVHGLFLYRCVFFFKFRL